MINDHYICVFDLETDSGQPDIANPVEIASVMIHPRSLKIVPDGDFCSLIRPPSIHEPEYVSQHADTIDWHARQLGITPAEVVARWKEAPSEQTVWNNFKAYLSQYHARRRNKPKSKMTAPIAAGHNIIRFDLPILTRLAEKYKDVDSRGDISLFFPRDIIDTMQVCWLFFEDLVEPQSLNMDVLREFFGIPADKSHTALKDAMDVASMLTRFMRFTREYSSRIQFKDSFK